MDEYGTIITTSRYQGAYEGGVWLAFPRDHYEPDGDWESDDTSCFTWWDTHPWAPLIGRGETPDEALADMKRRAGSYS